MLPDFKPQKPQYVAEVFFMVNYIGCVFSRGLQQQYMLWFWYGVPFLFVTGPLMNRKWTSVTFLTIWSVLSFGYQGGRHPATVWVVQPIQVWIIWENMVSPIWGKRGNYKLKR